MNKEKEEALKKQMREIHKKAAALNEALEKKEHEEVKQRLKEERKRNKEANSVSYKSAAKTLRFPEDRGEKLRTFNEILKDGTPKERAIFAITDYDLLNESDERISRLSDRSLKRLKAAVLKSSIDEQNEFMYYIREANKIFRFVPKLSYNFKMYQLEVTLLAQLVTKWEDYDRAARQQTELYHSLSKATFWIGEPVNEKKLYDSEAEKAELRKRILHTAKEWDKATLCYDEATDAFFADIDGKGKLYEEIKKQIKDTEEYLSYFKGSAIAMAEYIEEIDLPVTPLRVYDVTKNVEGELYSGSLIENKNYYRSHLNKRKQNGETITPEDEKRAVFPDYQEMVADEHSYTYFREVLHNPDN